MLRLLRAIAVASAMSAVAWAAHAQSISIKIVAGENVYGDIARQIAGDHADVVSIMSNPDQDPHLFETTPSVARDLSAARIVIANGAGYDPWIGKLLQAMPRPGRTVITVANLVGRRDGDNPHLWYDPPTASVVAKAVSAALTTVDPARKSDYAARLKSFLESLTPIQAKIAAIRGKYAGAPVTASEPVVGYMAQALGLKMRNERFQLAIMNDTEPSPRDVGAFEEDLKQHKVRVMFFNKQASDKAVDRLVTLARAARIPVVGVSETKPPGMSFQDWMLSQLDATEKALAGPSS